MDIVSVIVGVAAVGIFLWLIAGSGSTSDPQEPTSSRESRRSKERATQIGVGSGMLGGSVESAVKAAFALRRGHGKETDASHRDTAAAVAMQSEQPDP